jgi:hypothetical protein
MSIAFNYFGLSLSFAPQQYKAFGTRLNRPFARSPIWFIRAVGILLVMLGFALFYALVTKGRST